MATEVAVSWDQGVAGSSITGGEQDTLSLYTILNASKNATFTVLPYSRFNAILSF